MTNKAPSDSKIVGSARKPPNAGMGRKPGVPNKTTAAVKEALQLAFEGTGGVPALIEWVEGNRTEFYKLWIKMLPTEIAGKLAVTLTQEEALDELDPR